MHVELQSAFWYPTEDGQYLCGGDVTTLAGLELRIHDPGSETDFQTAVLAADLSVADREGTVWNATSFVTADIFLKHMVDVSSHWGTTVFSVREGRSGVSEWDAAFRDRPLLSRVICLEDDRFYRTLLLQTYGTLDASECRPPRIVEFKFHYSTFLFDIAAILWDPKRPSVVRDLAIRVNDGEAWEYLRDSNGDPFGTFGFVMDWRYLLTNSADVTEEGRWITGDLPLPLVFRRTEETAEPQAHVRCVPWSDPLRSAVQGR